MNASDYERIKALKEPAATFDLTGRAGLITGGGGMMGRDFATMLIRAGADVAISDLNEKKCSAAAADIEKRIGKRVSVIPCDVSKEKQVKALFHEMKNQFGKLDFFIHNVMSKPEGYYKSFAEYSLSTWNRAMEDNLSGAFLCCREAIKLMKVQRDGSIVLTSSIYAIVGPDHRIYEGCKAAGNPYDSGDALNLPGVYAASKGGLNAFAKYLATLVGSDRIRVNILIPGGVFDHQDPCFHKAYIDRTPIGRMAVWSDFNGAILFLVSDASRYMTGAELVIDGGWCAW